MRKGELKDALALADLLNLPVVAPPAPVVVLAEDSRAKRHGTAWGRSPWVGEGHRNALCAPLPTGGNFRLTEAWEGTFLGHGVVKHQDQRPGSNGQAPLRLHR